jgi:hypothetical protein
MVLVRMFGIGIVSILACAYALVRHYTVKPEPMLVPSPAATELAAPELELVPLVGPGAPERLPSALPELAPPPPVPPSPAPSR